VIVVVPERRAGRAMGRLDVVLGAMSMNGAAR
jgi:hypothetical protein